MDSPTQLPSPEHYSNAEEYIRDRLSVADRPLSPSGLADEYECGNIHMRKELSRLSNEGVVERVSRGQYTLSETSESSESVMSHGESHGRDGNPTSNTDENTNDNQRETTLSRQSTAELYQRQYNQSGDDTNDDTNVEVTTESDSTPMLGLPMNPNQLGVIIVIVLVLWVVSRRFSGSSTQQSDSQSDSQTDSQTDSQSQPTKGLIQ